jgi:uncharacterized protein (TIGR00251 family)
MIAEHPDGVLVETWVVPGASRTEVVGIHDGALRLRVAVPPQGGKANEVAARLLGEVFGGARVELVSGASSRRKRFVVRTSATQAKHALRQVGVLPRGSGGGG